MLVVPSDQRPDREVAPPQCLDDGAAHVADPDRGARDQNRTASRHGGTLPYARGLLNGLHLGHATIDEELDPGDVAAVVRGEEHGCVRHLVRRAHPAHRRGGNGCRLELVALIPRPPPL